MIRLLHMPAFLVLALLPSLAGAQTSDPIADGGETGEELIHRLAADLLGPSPDIAEELGPLTVEYRGASVVNAFATRTPQGTPLVIFYDGIVAALDRDDRLVRAVVAHELSHLAQGHVREVTRPKSPMLLYPDVRYYFIRQVEFEADAAAAKMLDAAGYSRTDLEDALLQLHAVHREFGVSWLRGISDDHGSWLERITRIAPTDDRYAALSAFERGLAFVECRRPAQAMIAFERALEIEPMLDEARFGLARALLQEYYDQLPDLVRDEWLRPDFGPQLTLDDVFAVRGAAATAADRRRWNAVREVVLALPRPVSPGHYELLLGTVDVLHPDGDPSIVTAGVARLQGGMLQPSVARRHRERIRLALANNAALGLHRLGETDGALGLLSAELEDLFGHERYLHLSNVARLTLIAVHFATSEVVVEMLREAMRASRADSERYANARGALERIGSSIGADLLASGPPSDLQVCRPTVVEMAPGVRVGLFADVDGAIDSLGSPDVDERVHPDYEAFRVLAWRDERGATDLVALIEDGRPLKLTTYRPGSAVLLEPAEESDIRTIRIEIGATADELDEVLDGLELSWDRVPGQRFLARSVVDGDDDALDEELWTYLPDLSLAVLVEDGVLRGLTMTPVGI
ncbi:MAG: M48 family metalloprotease [Planctomycetota bacterium]